MVDSNYTAVAIVSDRSGSMMTMQKDAEGGINSFINDQKNQPGRCSIRIDQFDTQYENVVRSTDVENVKPYRLVPRGGTALLDAIGKTVTDFGAELAAMPENERPGNVIVVVVTDGEENSSREWDAAGVKALIAKQEQEFNWTFVFLAANQDAIQTGATYGFGANTSMTYDSANVGATYATLSHKVTATRSSGKFDAFTDDERAASGLVQP